MSAGSRRTGQCCHQDMTVFSSTLRPQGRDGHLPQLWAVAEPVLSPEMTLTELAIVPVD